MSIQLEGVTGNVTIDVGKEIFVCRDPESRRSVLPFDLKRAAGDDVRKRTHRAVVGFNITIATNSDPPASGGQNNAQHQKYNYALLHMRYPSGCYDAKRRRFGSNKIPGGGLFPNRLSGGSKAAAPCSIHNL
jgi:hypothetical protein